MPLLAAAQDHCSRIIPLSPSLAEIVYQLGLGEHVVGRTRYSHYPPEIRRVTALGGLLDPNLEAIVALRPTTVLALIESKERLRALSSFGIQPLFFDHRSLKDILFSIRALGEACGRMRESEALVQRLQHSIEAVRSVTAQRDAPSVMIVVGGESAQGNLRNVFISGSDGYYSELLSIARGTNVMRGVTAPASGLSLEGIIELNPEIIIEVQPPSTDSKGTLQAIRRAWSQLPSLSAVQRGRVYLLDNDYATIPGPRFDLLLRDFVRLLHGEEVAKEIPLLHE